MCDQWNTPLLRQRTLTYYAHTSKCSLSDLFNSEKRDTVEDDMYHSELKRQNSLDVFLQRLESQVGANITDDNSKKKMLNNQVQLLVKNNPKLKSKMDDIEYRAIHNGQTALDEPEEIYSVGQPKCKSRV